MQGMEGQISYIMGTIKHNSRGDAVSGTLAHACLGQMVWWGESTLDKIMTYERQLCDVKGGRAFIRF